MQLAAHCVLKAIRHARRLGALLRLGLEPLLQQGEARLHELLMLRQLTLYPLAQAG